MVSSAKIAEVEKLDRTDGSSDNTKLDTPVETLINAEGDLPASNDKQERPSSFGIEPPPNGGTAAWLQVRIRRCDFKSISLRRVRTGTGILLLIFQQLGHGQFIRCFPDILCYEPVLD